VDARDYIAELTAMVTNHWNSPAIIMWDIFNEGQGEAGSSNGIGQTNTAYLVSLVKTLDPSRLVNQASGWNWVDAGDVEDTHNYPDPECSTSSSQAVVCGEFGGVWLGVAGHTWSPSSSDVPVSQAASTVTPQFQSLAAELQGLIQTNGLSAAVYTEISDVEIELAGLETFDRKILKPDLQQMQSTITSLTGALLPTNTPPVLTPIANATITAGQTLLVTNAATDADVPTQTLTWSLATKPTGATINATNGLITWRPTISQSPSTNLFSVVVTDNGTPPLISTQKFSVFALRPATPVLSSPTTANGEFQCRINGSIGPDYSIYTTTNLSSGWQLLLTTNPTTLPFQFTDSNFSDFQQRYYRVLLGP
jgi:Putative Ig domain/Glycosyl hydrolases family 2, TIM barrel domain